MKPPLEVSFMIVPVPFGRRFVTGLLEEFENRRCGEGDDDDDGPNDDDSFGSHGSAYLPGGYLMGTLFGRQA